MQTFTGIDYLKIDIANNFGKDKLCWADRIAWVDQNESRLETLLSEAEEPALYFAGVEALRATMRSEPTGYPISLDATSSGLQLLAVLAGDRSAAALCNVVDTGSRVDAYTKVFEIMVTYLEERLGPDVAGKIDRSDLKQAIMTSLYGSTAIPKKIFGKGAQLAVFYEVMEELAPAAWNLNKFFLEIWDAQALTNDWVLPDNFHVHVKVMDSVTETVQFRNAPVDFVRKVNMATEEGRSLGANTIHSIDGMIVREMSRRCNHDRDVVIRVNELIDYSDGGDGIDPRDADTIMVKTLWELYEKSGFLSARILEHLTNDNFVLVESAVIEKLIDSLPAKPFQVVCVHDCFRCLPNYGNDLRKQYNLILHLIGKSDMLSFLLSQLMKTDVQFGPMDPTLADDILNAEYALS